MRIATFKGTGTITITGAGDRSRTIGPGGQVDLDEVLIPHIADRPAQTVEHALGKYIDLFDVEEEAPRARSRRAGRSESAED